jgi:ABC-2 type transport system ATP-binding protein
VPRDRYERMLVLVRALLGLDEFFHSLARELSLGQRMRADLGLTLLHDPEILLLDEPTLGLDVLAKRRVLEFVKELNRERGVTVLVTSHDMGDLEQLASRIVLIHRGEIAFDGDWPRLRRSMTERRRLLIETNTDTPPRLAGAELAESAGGRHTYLFDAATVRLSELLEQASAQAEVLDVETPRPDIDDVIADIYESWQKREADREPPVGAER